MKFSKVLEKLIFPILVAVLSPLLLGLISGLSMNDPLMIFENIPITIYIVFVFLIVIWIFYILYKKRKKSPGAYGIIEPLYGYKDIMEISYNNAIWKIQIPKQSDRERLFDMYMLSPADINYNQLKVHEPPLCINCKCELEERKRLIKGYIWSCVNCGHKVKSKDSYSIVSDRVLKIAKQKFQ